MNDVKQVEEINVYCRNCGNKLMGKRVCDKCQVEVIDERIRCDNGYIGLIALNLMLIVLGLVVPSILKFWLFGIAFLVIQMARRMYKNSFIVYILFFLESLVVYGLLFLLIWLLISCG